MILIRNQHIGYSPHGCTRNEVIELDRYLLTGLVQASPACVAVVMNGARITMDITIGRGDWRDALHSSQYKQFNILSGSQTECIGRCTRTEEELLPCANTDAIHHGQSSRRDCAIGAAMPQELFSRILYYASEANRIEEGSAVTEPPDFCRHRWDQHDSLNYSLVCVYWVNQCRRYIFLGVPCRIDLPARLDMLRRTLAWGDERSAYSQAKWLDDLITVNGVIVSVKQEWKPGSWFQHVWPMPLKDVAYRLELDGSTKPDNVKASAYQSPYWNLPRPLPSSFMPYHIIELRRIHFSSIRHFIKLLSYFKCARRFLFENLEWDGKAGLEPLQPLQSGYNGRDLYNNPVKSARIDAENCSNNVLACLQTCRFHKDLPLGFFVDSLEEFEQQLLKTLNCHQFTRCSAEWGGVYVDSTSGRKFTLELATTTLVFILGFTVIRNPVLWTYPSELSAVSIRIGRAVAGSAWTNAHAADLSSSIDLKAFWDILDNLARLNAVLVLSTEYDVLARILEQYPCLRKGPSPGVMHCHAFKSSWDLEHSSIKSNDWIKLDTKSGQPLEDQTWLSEDALVTSTIIDFVRPPASDSESDY